MLNNLDPNLWGLSFWRASHFITLAYPDQPTLDDKNYVRTYFENLKYLLPCEKCREHYAINLKNKPLTDEILSSRNKIILWLFELHNLVNTQLDKPTITLEQFYSIYSKPLSPTNGTMFSNLTSNTWTIILLIVLILLLIFYVRYKN